MQYAGESLTKFLDDLAAKQETPGGGSAAAVAGALAAGLGSMVCQYTVGKKKYADVEDRIREILQRCDNARKQFLQLMQDDIDVFQNKVAAAYKMPKDTAEQKQARENAISQAAEAALEPPMNIARLANDLLGDMKELAEKGNAMLVSDVGVAVEMLHAAHRSAWFNLDINLQSIADKTNEARLRREVVELGRGFASNVKAAIDAVHHRLHEMQH